MRSFVAVQGARKRFYECYCTMKQGNKGGAYASVAAAGNEEIQNLFYESALLILNYFVIYALKGCV